jgi:hypothetical protein
VVLSEKVPTALNCCNTPRGIEEFAGVTTIEISVALVTVSVAVPEMAPDAARMVVVPAVRPRTVPLVGIESLIEPTAGADEVQVTLLVMFCVLPSAYVPVAVNEVAVVAAIDMLGGLTAIDVKGGGTVKTVVPLMAPDVALMVVVPKATLVARPPALMVALAGVEELQVTEPVRSWVGPLE